MVEMTAGQALVEVLKAEGIRCVFGLPGGHVIDIYDALYATPEIRHVLVRHEYAAACMAAGYTQLTGEPAVCLVTAGPGATNLLTGIAEASVGSLPVIILAGRGATGTVYRGASQEIATDRMFAPVTKWSVRVDQAGLLVEALRQAFTIARGGKPGPVLIDIPRDLLGQPVALPSYQPAGPPARAAADPLRIKAAADALLGAARPVIVAGGGTVASGAFSELRELAELLTVPVLTSLSGRGSIPDDHPLSAGGLGAHRNPVSARLLADADVVLGLGTRFEEMETNWRRGFVPGPDACYVQVDVDPAEIGRSVVAQIGVVGDIRQVLGQLLAAVRGRLPGLGVPSGPALDGLPGHPRVHAIGAGISELEKAIDQAAGSDEVPIHPLRVIRAVRSLFPRDTTVAIDVGCLAQHIAGAFPFFRVYEPRSLIVPSSFYGMGFAAAALPAARVVYPGRPAVGFVGDGSFQMVMNVLPTAAEHRLPVTWCVLNDGALGSIWDIQALRFGRRILGTEFSLQPDFAKIADACGCYGRRIEDPAEVDSAIAEAMAANERGQPAVLDFAVARSRLRQTREHFTYYPDPGDDVL
jgi:acetolactate synthase-1/2/3 large subunit